MGKCEVIQLPVLASHCPCWQVTDHSSQSLSILASHSLPQPVTNSQSALKTTSLSLHLCTLHCVILTITHAAKSNSLAWSSYLCPFRLEDLHTYHSTLPYRSQFNLYWILTCTHPHQPVLPQASPDNMSHLLLLHFYYIIQASVLQQSPIQVASQSHACHLRKPT